MAFKLIVQNSKIVLKSVANYIINATGIKDLFTGDSSIDSNGKINWTLQHYVNTAANFTSANPTLLVGQIGIETDDLLTTPKFKIGNGVTAWNSLPYFSSGSTPTLEQVRSEDNSISGDINANNNTIINLKDAVNPQEPITKIQFDTYVSAVGGQRGGIDCSTNPNYPASNKGDRWEVTVAGKIGGALGVDVQLYDEIVCKTTTVGGDQASVGSNFYVVQGNLERATETVSGYVQLATDVETQGGTENTKATTALKLANWWTNVKTLAHTFAAKITFTTAPRFSFTTANQRLEVDSNKDVVSVAKGTADNKNFGTTAGTVLEGNRITQTITDGVTDKAPSEDTVFDALALKADLTTPMIVFSPIKRNTTISHTGTTSETKLYSVLIPAGTMKANDILEYYVWAIPGTGSGNRTLKVYLNTSDAIGGIQIATYTFTTTSNIFKRKITFKNSLSTQEIIPASASSIGNFELSTYASSNVSSISANFNNDVWFVISMTLSTASDNVSIYSIGSNILR